MSTEGWSAQKKLIFVWGEETRREVKAKKKAKRTIVSASCVAVAVARYVAVGFSELGNERVGDVGIEAALGDADANETLVVVGVVDGGNQGRVNTLGLALE